MLTPTMRVLAAPDKFKGTLTAFEVAAAIAAGLDCEVDACPIADGGEGTAEVLVAALGGFWARAPAHDALGREVECRYGLLDDGATAVIEVAEASGLWRLTADELDASAANSAGTGELIADAIARGARRILVACGGSASTDAGLSALERFDPSAAELVCLCDTDVDFLAAATVYAPQKGAGEQEVAELSRRLEAAADGLPRDPRGLPDTGAAGGLAGGFWAHGASLVSGAGKVLSAIGFDERLGDVDLVITGEGRLDETSLRGKAVGEVLSRCNGVGIPCHAIVGIDALGFARSGLASVHEAGAPAAIAAAAAEIAGNRSGA